MGSIPSTSVVKVIYCLFITRFVLTFAEKVTKDCFCLAQELTNIRNPIHMESVVKDNKEVYLLAEQIGIIYIFNPKTGTGNKLAPYIDISGKVVCKAVIMEERGLLGFAAHPDFTNNKKVYTYSIRDMFDKEYAVISEITDGDVEHEKILMLIEQPGHTRNGGQLLFGADGFLYIFVGDGQPAEDKLSKAQDGSSFLGKVLRIDVDTCSVVEDKLQFYSIPQDNPITSGWRDGIYAIGGRNMWRCWMDSGDQRGDGKGRIFCGDLGSGGADEINIIQKGGNYGWQYMEGTTCVGNLTDCSSIENQVLPIKEFSGPDRNVSAVVGGPVYRGETFSDMYGQLMYGDFISSRLFRLKYDNGRWDEVSFSRCSNDACACDARHYRRAKLLSFGQTHSGEILLLMTETPNPHERKGVVLKLTPPNKSGHVTCGASSYRHSVISTSLSLFIIYAHIFKP